MTWTIERGPAGGGALTSHTLDEATPDFFFKRLNGVGFFSAVFYNGAVPSRDDLVRFIWDKGGSDERVHFEGFITDVRRVTETSTLYRARGLSLEGLLWTSGIGDVREYSSERLWDIWQRNSPTRGLLFNSQGALRVIGSVSVSAGSASDVPWKVESGGTDATSGPTHDFRADSAKQWVNIQRLLLQARHDATQYPNWAATPAAGDGDPYGLESFVRLETANNDTPRAYLVGRRERSSNHTPETYDTKTDLLKPRRGQEGLTAAEAIRVIGAGDGSTRIESSLIGSGGLEGIIADKTLATTTNANNQALRLNTLLDPSTEVFTAWLPKHAYDTEIGDRITITDPDQANETLRVFAIGYQVSKQSFFLVAGRPRPFPEDPFSDIASLAGGQAQAPQVTDTKPESIRSNSGSRFFNFFPSSSFNVSAGGVSSSTDWEKTSGWPTDFELAEEYLIRCGLKISITDARLEVDYDKTTSVGISDENSGNAGADPHGHTATPSHSSTAATVRLQGPYRVQLEADIDESGNGSVDRTDILGQWVFPNMPLGTVINETKTYPFSMAEETSTLLALRAVVRNDGDTLITVSSDSTIEMVKGELHRHNASTVIT